MCSRVVKKNYIAGRTTPRKSFCAYNFKELKLSNTLLPGQTSPQRWTGPRMSAIECAKGKPYHWASPPLFFGFTKSREEILDEIAEHFKILASLHFPCI